MVANKVEVVSTPAALDDDGQIQSAHKWISEGAGSYSIEKVEGTPETRGTKIIMHLRIHNKQSSSILLIKIASISSISLLCLLRSL